MKKSVLKLAVVVAATLAVATGAFADSSSCTVNANATGQIIQPIGIEKGADLSFGKAIVDQAMGGTVTVDTDGFRSFNGGVVAANGQFGNSANAATFWVTGEPNATYAITLPEAITVDNGGGAMMTISSFTSNPSVGAGGNLGVGGSQPLTVGATLNVGPGQPSGIYATTMPFSVTVAYN